MIRYLDVCSGYSAFTQGAVGLGYECLGYAEIDAFPSALLGHHYGASRPRYMPDPLAEMIDANERKSREEIAKRIGTLSDSHFGNAVTNFGDFSQIREDDIRGPVHLLTGGTPCQAFSVAGKRLGLDDPRGNLTLEFLALAKRVRAEWLAWENVPGILSHDDGRTMGTFLWLLGQLGYGWAYRVLDAQYIRVDGCERAVPQRRRRVIVVAHLGDAAGPAAVLFDRESLRGNPAPRRETGQGIAAPTSPCLVSGGRGVERTGETRGQDPVVAVAFGGNDTRGPIDIATARSAHGGPHGRLDFESETFIAQPIAASLTRGAESAGKGGYAGRRQEDDVNLVAHSLRAEGFDASKDGTGRGTPLVPVAFAIQAGALRENPDSGPDGVGVQSDHAYTLEARPEVQAVAFAQNTRDEVRMFGGDGQTVGALGAEPGMKQQSYVAQPIAFDARQTDVCVHGDITQPIDTKQPGPAVAFSLRGREGEPQAEPAEPGLSPSLRTVGGGSSHAFVAQEWAVRRLTPRECERLMGLSDDFTDITYRGKPAADGPRYKALGNSQARNMMRWIAIGIRDVIEAQAGALK